MKKEEDMWNNDFLLHVLNYYNREKKLCVLSKVKLFYFCDK